MLHFRTSDTNELAKLILNGAYCFDGKVWGRVSNEAKDLIERMLTVDPKQRISVDDIFMHKWLLEVTSPLYNSHMSVLSFFFFQDLPLQYDVAKFLNYIPDSSQSDFSSDCLEPPLKKQNLSTGETNSVMHSWP